MHDWSTGSGSSYYPRVSFRPPGLTRSAVETLLRSPMMGLPTAAGEGEEGARRRVTKNCLP